MLRSRVNLCRPEIIHFVVSGQSCDWIWRGAMGRAGKRLVTRVCLPKAAKGRAAFRTCSCLFNRIIISLLLLCFFSQAFLGSQPNQNHLQSAGKNKKLLIQSSGRSFPAVVIWDHRYDEPLLPGILGILPFFPLLLQSFLLPQCLFISFPKMARLLSFLHVWYSCRSLFLPYVLFLSSLSLPQIFLHAHLSFSLITIEFSYIPLWEFQLVQSAWCVFQTPTCNCCSFLYLAVNLQLSPTHSGLASGSKANGITQFICTPAVCPTCL